MKGKQKDVAVAPACADSINFGAARCQHYRRQTSSSAHGWSAQPDHFEQVHRLEQIWRSLDLLLPGIARPTRADIEVDKYDGSVAISQWLAHTKSLTPTSEQ